MGTAAMIGRIVHHAEVIAFGDHGPSIAGKLPPDFMECPNHAMHTDQRRARRSIRHLAGSTVLAQVVGHSRRLSKDRDMAYFAVFGEYGPGRQPGLALGEQPGWRDHAEFMDALYDEGVVLLAGTMGVGDSVLLIAAAESGELLEERLSQDPWRKTGTLLAPRIEPWQVRLGELPTPSK